MPRALTFIELRKRHGRQPQPFRPARRSSAARTTAHAEDADRRQAAHWRALADQQRERDQQLSLGEEEAEADSEPEAGL